MHPDEDVPCFKWKAGLQRHGCFFAATSGMCDVLRHQPNAMGKCNRKYAISEDAELRDANPKREARPFLVKASSPHPAVLTGDVSIPAVPAGSYSHQLRQ